MFNPKITSLYSAVFYWILILFLSLILPANIFGQNILFVEKSKESYPLGRYISVLEDKEGCLSIKDAAADSLKNRFAYLNKETLTYRFSRSVFWIRLQIIDTLPRLGKLSSSDFSTWLLIRNDPIQEDIRLYQRSTDSAKTGNHDTFIETRSGSIIPVENKDIHTNEFVAYLHVQKKVLNTFYIRVETGSQIIISFEILTPEQYIIHTTNKSYFHGILFGILFLLIGYNLLLYFSIKENTYLFYVLYIFCYSAFVFVYEGYYFQFFGRAFRHDYFILNMIPISLTGIFWLLFTREFLSTKIFLPSAYKLLNYLAFLGPVLFIFTFFSGSIIMFLIWSSSNVVFFTAGIIIAILTYKRGNKISIIYIVALSGVALGIIILIATRNNYLPLNLNFWTQNALHFGTLWEAIVLAYTVGYKFNLLKMEKEKEKEMIRNQIASDLHDEVASNLSTISLQSQMMVKTNQVDEKVKKQLLDIALLAGLTTETIRDIVWFINPFHDKSEDLVLRMKELTSKMLINSDYTFDAGFAGSQIFDVLPDLRKRRHIYLIFKETLNNINKHSLAKNITISIYVQSRKFIMIINDDGIGFNEEIVSKGEGLKNLRNRAALMDAEILIECGEEKGTTIVLKVPL